MGCAEAKQIKIIDATKPREVYITKTRKLSDEKTKKEPAKTE